MELNKYNRDSFHDALFAARSRLIPPVETPAERRDKLIEAAQHIDEAVISLLHASRCACLADDEELATAIDDARAVAAKLKTYLIVRGAA